MSSNSLPLSNTLQQRLNANVKLKVFLREAEDLIQANPQSGFAECGCLLEAVCRKGTFTGLVNYELECLLREPNYALEGSSDLDMLVLRSRFFNLKLKMAGPTAQTNRLIGLAADMILVPLSASGVTMTCYREPPNPATETLDRSGPARKAAECDLALWPELLFRSGPRHLRGAKRHGIDQSNRLPFHYRSLNDTMGVRRNYRRTN